MTPAQADWYHQHATVQMDVARDLARHMEIPADGTLLEIGCGSGFLTQQLPPERTLATDLSPAMVERARITCPGYQLRPATLEDRSLDDTEWAMVVSSSALHWVTPFERAATRLADLAPAFAIAIMLDGTLDQLQAARTAAAPAKTPRAVLPRAVPAARALRAAGFTDLSFRLRVYEKPYPDALSLLTDLNRSGLTGSGSVLSPAEVRTMARNLNRQSPIIARYRVGFFFGKL